MLNCRSRFSSSVRDVVCFICAPDIVARLSKLRSESDLALNKNFDASVCVVHLASRNLTPQLLGNKFKSSLSSDV